MMYNTRFSVALPAGYSLPVALFGHGWVDVAPFSMQVDPLALVRVEHLPGGGTVRIVAQQKTIGGRLEVRTESAAALNATDEEYIATVLRTCLRVDEDLSAFYAVLAGHPRYAWVPATGSGTLLASPTVWEDLAKTLLTTNTTWRMTKSMAAQLNSLGAQHAPGQHAWPTAQAIATMPMEELAASVRAGYRVAYLHELAQRIASGQLPVEQWRNATYPAEQLEREMRSIRGFGPYAIGAMQRLLGRYLHLGLDSVCRSTYRTRVQPGAAGTDKEIVAYYAPMAPWGGLAVWMDVMEQSIRRDIAAHAPHLLPKEWQ